MATPTAAYSVAVRVRLDNSPGSLGRLAAAIGDAGGNIVALDGFEAKDDHLDEDVIVNCSSVAHIEASATPSTGSTAWTCSRSATARSPCTTAARSRCSPACRCDDRDDLSMAYTPGVARVCTAIAEHPARVHELTIKKNTVAIVTDGTAVLGLGDIGPDAALPVMEGKALLFKNFAGVDAFPICLDVGGPRHAGRRARRGHRRDGAADRPGLRRHQPRGHRRAGSASRSRSGCGRASTSPSSTTTSTAPRWSRWPRSRTR